MSSNFRRAILVLLVSAMLISGVALPWSPVKADDSDMDVQVNVLANHLDLEINVSSSSTNIWINGVPWETLIASAMPHNITELSAPNSQWSGGDATGWDGYYGIRSNDVSVTVNFDDGRPSKVFKIYRGAGCGVWGVNDGYPDSWARRQILALAIRDAIREYQVEYLKKDLAAQAKTIALLSENVTTMKAEIEQMIISENVTRSLTVRALKDIEGVLSFTLDQINLLKTSFLFIVIGVIGLLLAAGLALFFIVSRRKRNY